MPKKNKAVRKFEYCATSSKHRYNGNTETVQQQKAKLLGVDFQPKTQSQLRFLDFSILVHITVAQENLPELIKVRPADARLRMTKTECQLGQLLAVPPGNTFRCCPNWEQSHLPRLLTWIFHSEKAEEGSKCIRERFMHNDFYYRTISISHT